MKNGKRTNSPVMQTSHSSETTMVYGVEKASQLSQLRNFNVWQSATYRQETTCCPVAGPRRILARCSLVEWQTEEFSYEPARCRTLLSEL